LTVIAATASVMSKSWRVTGVGEGSEHQVVDLVDVGKGGGDRCRLGNGDRESSCCPADLGRHRPSPRCVTTGDDDFVAALGETPGDESPEPAAAADYH